MKVLVLGGTRFFGVHLVRNLIQRGDAVTVATRGITPDPFGDAVTRVHVDRKDPAAMKAAFQGGAFDVVFDDLAYCSNDVKAALDAVECGRYIMASTMSVYIPDALGPDTPESAYRPEAKPLIWCDRAYAPYDEVKRLAECALVQHYPNQNAAMVRFPVVLGEDDYTKRLYFYVEHVLRDKPMYIDNLDCPMGFILSREAGAFLAFLAGSSLAGPVNASSEGTVSLREIIAYVEKKSGKRAALHPKGDPAPYNGAPSHSLHLCKAKSAGFAFSDIHDWIEGLLDFYCDALARV